MKSAGLSRGTVDAGLVRRIVLTLGILLRLALALVNRAANDAHLPVIETIAYQARFPERTELWEAFQPKLYHTTVAVLWRLWPAPSPDLRTVLAQLVSCVAGIAVLFVLLRFLQQLDISAPARTVTFALIALNPRLIGISAQATNDAFVILFGSLALYFGWRFIRDRSISAFLALGLSSAAAGLSKGNGLVTIIAVLLTFLLVLVRAAPAVGLSRRRTGIATIVFCATVLPTVWVLGPYGDHQRAYGSPFVTNWDPPPRPHLWRQTFVERPGLTSLVHGLLTFRFIDLMRHPVSTDHHQTYPLHRTSVWTRLYAQAQFIHFEGYPYSWGVRQEWVRQLGRMLFVLGLFPALLFTWKLLVLSRDMVRALLARGPPMPAEQILVMLALLGYIAFVAVYAVHLRDYSSMKLIFALPALPGFALVLGRAFESFYARTRNSLKLRGAAHAVVAALLIGYITDIAVLIRDLSVSG